MLIKKIVEKYLGNHSHVEQTSQYMYHCPKCNWKNPRLSINFEENKFKCWKCGFSSLSLLWLLKSIQVSEEDFMKARSHFGYSAALSSEYSCVKSELDNLFDEKNDSCENVVYPYSDNELSNIDPFFIRDIVTHLKKRRRLTKSEILMYKFAYEIKSDKLVIPSQGLEKINYWIYYDVGSGFYMLPKGLKKTDIIFNEKAVNFYDEVIVTEGFFDSCAVGYNAVPSLGTLLPSKLIEKLVSYSSKVTIAFDKDAFEQCMSQCHRLYDYGLEVNYVDMWNVPHKDFDEAGKKKTKQILESNTKKYLP